MSPLVRAFVPVTANLSKKADINRKYEVNCVNKQYYEKNVFMSCLPFVDMVGNTNHTKVRKTGLLLIALSLEI